VKVELLLDNGTVWFPVDQDAWMPHDEEHGSFTERYPFPMTSVFAFEAVEDYYRPPGTVPWWITRDRVVGWRYT